MKKLIYLIAFIGIASAQQTRCSEIAWEDSEQQSGAYCGYFAVWNGVSMYNKLVGKPIPKFDLPQLQKAIKERREEIAATEKSKEEHLNAQHTYSPSTLRAIERAKHTDWLDDGEVDFLAHKLGLQKSSYTVVPDIHTVDLLTLDTTPIRHLREMEGFTHLFLSGNMQQAARQGDPNSYKKEGTQGHWIPVLADHKTRNERSYSSRDSLGKHTAMAQAVKNLVESDETLKPNIPLLTASTLNDVQCDINKRRPSDALQKLEKLADIAHGQNNVALLRNEVSAIASRTGRSVMETRLADITSQDIQLAPRAEELLKKLGIQSQQPLVPVSPAILVAQVPAVQSVAANETSLSSPKNNSKQRLLAVAGTAFAVGFGGGWWLTRRG